MPLMLSHVEVRVRDRAAATLFYDGFLSVLGAIKREDDGITTWGIPEPDGAFESAPDRFRISEDREHRPNGIRIAFMAPSRGALDAIATILPALGARKIDLDTTRSGTPFYAVRFDDPDGNRLEVAYPR